MRLSDLHDHDAIDEWETEGNLRHVPLYQTDAGVDWRVNLYNDDYDDVGAPASAILGFDADRMALWLRQIGCIGCVSRYGYRHVALDFNFGASSGVCCGSCYLRFR